MKGEKLIFIISQPRSGSSLTQQLLLKSDSITSSPESWQMLSLIHTYKYTNIKEGYNPNYTSINFLEYLTTLDKGLETVKQKIKDLALELYALKNEKNLLFLDKTPRYYHIIEELYELFPEAKFVFLVRNPLSVFASILDYNFNGNFIKFLKSKDRVEDLYTAPLMIKNAVKSKKNHILVKYEDLIENAEDELSRIFNYLKLETPNEIGTYEVKDIFNETHAIDGKSLKNHKKPSKAYLNSWKKSIDSTQKKKLVSEYIDSLNKKYNNYFDYNLTQIASDLKTFKPKKSTLFNLNLNTLITEEEKLSITSVLKKRIILTIQRIK